jgi:hypothetical protein
MLIPARIQHCKEVEKAILACSTCITSSARETSLREGERR